MTTETRTVQAVNPVNEAQYDAMPWLHVYPQYAHHSELRIVGNREALLALANALRGAASVGSGKSEGVTRDGEGYSIEVLRTNRVGIEHTSLPYTADFARDLETSSIAADRIEALEKALGEIVALEVHTMHDGYDSGAGGGNYVYAYVIRFNDVKKIARAALSPPSDNSDAQAGSMK